VGIAGSKVEAMDVDDGPHGPDASAWKEQRPTRRPASRPPPEGEGGVMLHVEATISPTSWSTAPTEGDRRLPIHHRVTGVPASGREPLVGGGEPSTA